MQRIIVQLPESMLKELDRAAKAAGLSRAAFTRAALDAALAESRRRKEIGEIVRSYERTPQEDLIASKGTTRRAWPK